MDIQGRNTEVRTHFCKNETDEDKITLEMLGAVGKRVQERNKGMQMSKEEVKERVEELKVL